MNKLLYMEYLWLCSIQGNIGVIRCTCYFFGKYDFQNGASAILRILLWPKLLQLFFLTVHIKFFFLNLLLKFKLKKTWKLQKKKGWNLTLWSLSKLKLVNILEMANRRAKRSKIRDIDFLKCCLFDIYDSFSKRGFVCVPCDSSQKSYLLEFRRVKLWKNNEQMF